MKVDGRISKFEDYGSILKSDHTAGRNAVSFQKAASLHAVSNIREHFFDRIPDDDILLQLIIDAIPRKNTSPFDSIM